MSSAIRQLGQMALPAHDLARSIRLYRDVLGLPFIWSNDRMAFFQVAATRLLIEFPKTPAFDHPGSILYFDVADLIGELGGVAVWMACFRDPAGSGLALSCEQPSAR